MVTQRHRPWALIITVAVAAFVLVAVSARAQNPGGNPTAAKMKNPVPSTPASIAAGAATFKKYCSFCHGEGARVTASSRQRGRCRLT
jgi:cytochrome c5